MAEVLVIGSGAREHAIAATLIKSPRVHAVTVSPGNAGTSQMENVRNRPLNIKNHQEVIDACVEWGIALVVIGPEDPLADGLSDSLEKAGIDVFGPSKLAARIESSKAWAKDFMRRNSVPTAKYETFTNIKSAEEFIEKSQWDGFAIKASGLAGGKGVYVVDDKTSAIQLLHNISSNSSARIREALETIVIEEKLVGYEISVLAFCDGTNISIMPSAQDHKPRFGGGTGPNTGGMGVYSPCPLVSQEELDFIEENILQKTVDKMKEEGYPYEGVLYAGIMMTADGPKVLEFNCRFGDPEAQALLLLLNCDLYTVMMACAEKYLDKSPVVFRENKFAAAVSVVIQNYPDDVTKGLNLKIKGIDEVLEDHSTTIFMGGAKVSDKYPNDILTAGGRVLNVCATDETLEGAVQKALNGAGKISFISAPPGYEADFRGDIGFQAIKKILEKKCSKLNYRKAGVNIDEGNLFVQKIEKFTSKTKRVGVVSELGMFGAVFDTKLEGYENPLLISGTDGVGTKLKIAIEYDRHSTIGQDLVAMCVNDILVHSAEPLFFLDYLAVGKLDSDSKSEIVKGIAHGCTLGNCSLVGGETAEMPGMYSESDYDVAGFAVGAVQKDQMLPKMNDMKAGNVLIGVASSGLHSNGYSLVRKILEKLDLSYSDPAPFNPHLTLGEELLKPTHIYTPLLELLRSGLVLGVSHITGGGIEENLLRIIPKSLGVSVDTTWNIPSVFTWLSSLGVSSKEMLRTFNLGLGMILVTEARNERLVLDSIEETFDTCFDLNSRASYTTSRFKQTTSDAACWTIGSLVKKTDNRRFTLRGLDAALGNDGAILMDKFHTCSDQLSPRRKVAVLISGSGTNLQALLDHTMSGPSRAEISLVISNIPDVQGLGRAAKANVRTMVISHKDFSSRKDFENEIHKALTVYNIEIVCLAGFMRILTADFVQKWKGRMVNIHPSILPSFKGKDAQKQAIEAGVCVSGCTVHFVVADVDAGPIVTQETVPVLEFDTVDSLSERIKKAEHKAFPRALELLARGKVFLDDKGQIRRK